MYDNAPAQSTKLITEFFTIIGLQLLEKNDDLERLRYEIMRMNKAFD